MNASEKWNFLIFNTYAIRFYILRDYFMETAVVHWLKWHNVAHLYSLSAYLSLQIEIQNVSARLRTQNSNINNKLAKVAEWEAWENSKKDEILFHFNDVTHNSPDKTSANPIQNLWNNCVRLGDCRGASHFMVLNSSKFIEMYNDDGEWSI